MVQPPHPVDTETSRRRFRLELESRCHERGAPCRPCKAFATEDSPILAPRLVFSLVGMSEGRICETCKAGDGTFALAECMFVRRVRIQPPKSVDTDKNLSSQHGSRLYCESICHSRIRKKTLWVGLLEAILQSTVTSIVAKYGTNAKQ